MRLVVLTNQAQLDRFLEQGFRPEDFEIYCDRMGFSPSLRQRGIRFSELNEFAIDGQWQQVNAWACGAAAAWVHSARFAPGRLAYDFPAILYLHLSHILVNVLKNLLFAQRLIDRIRPESVLIFDDPSDNFFPQFSGNFFLNYFLSEEAGQRKIAVQKIRSFSGSVSGGVPSSPPLKERAKAGWRTFCQNINAHFSPLKRARGIWVYGSLRHLSGLMIELKKRKRDFFLYDDRFNFEQFLFALRNGIPYVTLGAGVGGAGEGDRFAADHLKTILESFDRFTNEGLLQYGQQDLAPFVREHVLKGLGPYLKNLAARESRFRKVLSAFSVKALLTDEDYGDRGGFLCTFLKKSGVPVFCVSHSATAVDFEVKREVRCIGQGTTFVNSEFERDIYAARGWNAGVFRIEGIPRYDAFAHKKSSAATCKRSAPVRLLFCANLNVFNYDYPDRSGYLGHLLYAMSETVKPTAELFFDTVKQVPGIEVLLKPHGLMGLQEWESLVAAKHASPPVRIIRSKQVIDRFFPLCDAMIISYWSTTLIEAAIYGLPIIFMDFTQTVRPSVEKFAKAGFCRVVRDADQLRQVLVQLREGRGRGILPQKDPLAAGYFTGRCDGCATLRVADAIDREMSERGGGG